MDKKTYATRKKVRLTEDSHDLSDLFTALVKAEFKTDCVKELKFHPMRNWRFDYALPQHRIALEVEGGAFKERTYWDSRKGKQITTVGGRHNSGVGFLNDMEKYNQATLLGWRLIRTTPQKLCSGETIDMLRALINAGTGREATKNVTK